VAPPPAAVGLAGGACPPPLRWRPPLFGWWGECPSPPPPPSPLALPPPLVFLVWVPPLKEPLESVFCPPPARCSFLAFFVCGGPQSRGLGVGASPGGPGGGRHSLSAVSPGTDIRILEFAPPPRRRAGGGVGGLFSFYGFVGGSPFCFFVVGPFCTFCCLPLPSRGRPRVVWSAPSPPLSPPARSCVLLSPPWLSLFRFPHLLLPSPRVGFFCLFPCPPLMDGWFFSVFFYCFFFFLCVFLSHRPLLGAPGAFFVFVTMFPAPHVKERICFGPPWVGKDCHGFFNKLGCLFGGPPPPCPGGSLPPSGVFRGCCGVWL